MSDTTHSEGTGTPHAPVLSVDGDVVLYQHGRLRFALPADRVTAELDVAEIAPLPWCPGFVRGSIPHDGRAVVVLDPAAFLGVAGSAEEEPAGQQVVVFSAAGTPLGLFGSRLGVYAADADDATTLMVFADRGKQCVRGCVRIDGADVPLLDPDRFAGDAQSAAPPAAEEDETEPDDVLLERARALTQVDAGPTAAQTGAKGTVIFPVSDEWYGVPAAAVREIHQPRWITRLPGAPAFLTGVVNLRGDIIAVLDLPALAGGRPTVAPSGSTPVVVMRHRGHDFAIRCGVGAEVAEVADDALQALPSTAVTAAATLAKGVAQVEDRLACILDLSLVLSSPALAQFASTEQSAKGEHAQPLPEPAAASDANAGDAADAQAEVPAPAALTPEDAAEREQLKRYREMFLQMADEMLQELDSTLLEAEKSPDDREVVNAAFRAAHSLKGAAASVELPAVSHVSHAMENVLGAAREGTLRLASDQMDVLLRAGDSVREMIEAVRAGADDGQEGHPILAELADLLQTDPASSMARARPQAQPKTATREAPAPPTTHTLDLGDSIRVPMPKLDALWNISGEFLTQQTALESHMASLEDAASQARILAEAWAGLAPEGEGASPARWSPHLTAVTMHADRQAAAESAKKLADRLDTLLLDAGAIISNVGITANELRADVLNLRMLPVGTVFKTQERLIRDLARAQGKDVALETVGGDTELDKRVLEEVGEALMHLVRNAVDHGIESPDERRTAGKSAQAQVRLAARHEGGEVVIDIADDGRGLDLGRLRAKAVAKGFCSQEDAAAMTDAEIQDLIFAPGMTTRDEVSDTSGRGVGMDVVRANIERLKGAIETRTVRGRGTTFSLRVPLTLGIIHGLFVHAAGELLCLPSSSVIEVLRLNRQELAWAGGVSTVEYHGGQIPVLPLSALLGLDDGVLDAGCEWIHVLVVQHTDRRVGLVVDRVVAELEIVVKSLGSLVKRVPNLFGATILGDGRISVILDVPGLVRSAERSGVSVRIEGKADRSTTPRTRQKILVVEDSIFTRELLRSILEVAGYEVSVATDGLDGLQAIERERVDLLVVDVEMPRMSGVELTRTLRSRESFRDLPVVMVTAQASDEERRRGLEAGADAYIIKGAFDQHSLVNTIEELIG